ncbi:MAG: hypothetical protein JW791_00920 [Nanoarchaeota archaeon]|nr:hypothetical protein [Nanoarchaeota archaeon]
MKSLIFLLIVLSISSAFSATSYGTTCTTTWWWAVVYWGCTINDGPCGANSAFTAGTCTASCSYCGSYVDPCDVATDLSGTCTCTSGYEDCINGATDGCETNINTDNSNCGSCGNDCTVNICSSNNVLSGGTCSSGSCTYSTTTDCNDQDGLYEGVYRDYYCSSGSCTYSTTNVDTSSTACSASGLNYISGATGSGANCCGDDGNSDDFYASSGATCTYCNNGNYGTCITSSYCSGSTYYSGGACSSTGCSFSTSTNCATSTCSAGNVRNYNGQCTASGCTYTTEDCDNYDGQYSGTYKDYSCSLGECVYTTAQPDDSSTNCANFYFGDTTRWIGIPATGDFPGCCGDDGTLDDFYLTSGATCTYCNNGNKNTCSLANSCSGTVKLYDKQCSSTGCASTSLECVGHTYCQDTNTLMTGTGCSSVDCTYSSSTCSDLDGVYGTEFLTFSCTGPAGVAACTSTTLDPDTSQTICELLGHTWNIGGTTNQCCGDDANEFDITSTFAASMDGASSDLRACCLTSSACASNNVCGQNIDADTDGDTDYCSFNNEWIDANGDENCHEDEYFVSGDCEPLINPEVSSVVYNGQQNIITEIIRKGFFAPSSQPYNMKVSVIGTLPPNYYYEITRTNPDTSIYVGDFNYFIDPIREYSVNYCYKVRIRDADGEHLSPYSDIVCAKYCSVQRPYGVKEACPGGVCETQDFLRDILSGTNTYNPTLCFESGGVYNCQNYFLSENVYETYVPADYNPYTLRVDLDNMNRDVPLELKVELKDSLGVYRELLIDQVVLKLYDENGVPYSTASVQPFTIGDEKSMSVYLDLSTARVNLGPVNLYECSDGTARISISYAREENYYYLSEEGEIVEPVNNPETNYLYELDENGNNILTNALGAVIFQSPVSDYRVYEYDESGDLTPLVISSRDYDEFGNLITTNYVQVTHDSDDVHPGRPYDLMPVFWFDNGVLYGENGMECPAVNIGDENCYCDLGPYYLTCDSDIVNKPVIESFYTRNLINDLDFSNNMFETSIHWCVQ